MRDESKILLPPYSIDIRIGYKPGQLIRKDMGRRIEPVVKEHATALAYACEHLDDVFLVEANRVLSPTLHPLEDNLEADLPFTDENLKGLIAMAAESGYTIGNLRDQYQPRFTPRQVTLTIPNGITRVKLDNGEFYLFGTQIS